ncbi:MAG TPA: DUF6282 family protein [Methanobacterium sp.]|nr:DUF6282 family protein [Methanobacterium sp.]
MTNKNSIEGFIDTHIHTAPDIKPRILNDIETATEAKKEEMRAVVIKSHVESTASRAKIAGKISNFNVIGGLCLNSSIGGLNPEAVKVSTALGGKIIWFPTISAPKIDITYENTEEILNIIKHDDLVLATGHLKPDEIFQLLDHAKSLNIEKIIINHPLTGVVGASVDEQKEMSKYAFLEHCFVACMEKHDNLDPQIMADAIKEVGYKKCIMATDFGQAHNPKPVEGIKMFVSSMIEYGIKKRDINKMCIENPAKLFL